MPTGLFTLKQQVQALAQKAWTGTQKTNYVEYLVVAGGGGASAYAGGGAGGLLQGILSVATGTSITATVGAGGTSTPTSGVNSVFGAITAIGGGCNDSKNGGSGAGGNRGPVQDSIGIGGQGTAGQGNAGGFGRDVSANVYGGGGGGAGTVGLNATTNGYCGAGGAGIASVISGTVTTYAGGGGGGHAFGSVTSAGAGGVGGGGAGGNAAYPSPASGYNGTANTGGGGGAASYNGQGTGLVGGTGGSGIIIIRYPSTFADATSVTNGTKTTANGYTIYTFTSSGSITL